MKLLLTILNLFLCTVSFSQDNIIALVFTDKSNFDITTILKDSVPEKYYVLANTDRWNGNRFHLNKKQMRDRDEHSPYFHSYIFKDRALNKIISGKGRRHLYQLSQNSTPRPLSYNLEGITLIKTFEEAKTGFFLSVTDPIFTLDSQYAFIDITIHKKDRETKGLNESYFGRTFLIYQHVGHREWMRIKKIDHLIL